MLDGEACIVSTTSVLRNKEHTHFKVNFDRINRATKI
jgi:hypothetical protein